MEIETKIKLKNKIFDIEQNNAGENVIENINLICGILSELIEEASE